MVSKMTLRLYELIKCEESTYKRLEEICKDTHLPNDRKIHYLIELLKSCEDIVDPQELIDLFKTDHSDPN